ncbi:MAG: sugar transferase, partial [Pseudomonadota bacterium]|nr:sugar transferase [Pseudomonadota bacterium]
IFAISILYEVVHYIRLGASVDLFSIPFFTVLAAVLLTLYVTDVYRIEIPVALSRLPLTAAFASLFSILVSAAVIYAFGPLQFESIFGRGVMPVTLLLFSIWASWSRYALSRWFEKVQEESRWLYLGSVEKLVCLIKDFSLDSSDCVILLDDKKNEGVLPADYAKHVQGHVSQLASADLQGITDVIVATDHSFTDIEISTLMKIRASGAGVFDFTAFYEQYQSKVAVVHLKHGWFVQGGGFYLLQNKIGLKIKRIIDILLSASSILILSPVLLIIGIIVKLDSRGPVIYTQLRVGLNGKCFYIYKIRSMINDAERDGVKWAEDDDPRITRVGRFIRKTRIDELPQLLNVLKGDMSFIGPRPERSEFIKKLVNEIPYYDLRHLVLPGITGWAQVMYPYGASVEDAREKLEYDLYYIKNYSLLLDFAILMKTLRIMLWHRGR